MLEAFGLSQKKRRIAHDFMKTMPTNVAASKPYVCSGPNHGTRTQQNMASSTNNSLPFRPSELGASDGWFMGQDALSSEEESDNSSNSNEELSAQRQRHKRPQEIHSMSGLCTVEFYRFFEERSECYQTIVEITPNNCVTCHLCGCNGVAPTGQQYAKITRKRGKPS